MTVGGADRGPADERPTPAADDEAGLPDKQFFRIGESAQLVGVEPHVLRYWESEFGMQPRRSASGQRMYRRRDIARFVRIRRLLHDEGFTIAGARKAMQDPDSVEAGATHVEAARLTQACERIRGLRMRIAALRDRIGIAEVEEASTSEE